MCVVLKACCCTPGINPIKQPLREPFLIFVNATGSVRFILILFLKDYHYFHITHSRIMNMTDEYIREIWQFDGKSRELDGQKVGLQLIGFKAGQWEDIRESCLFSRYIQSTALHWHKKPYFTTEKSTAKAKKQVWMLKYTVFLQETGACFIYVEWAVCSLHCQQLVGWHPAAHAALHVCINACAHGALHPRH